MLFDPQRRADGVAAALLQAYLIVENTGQCKLVGHNAMDDKARIGHVELESNEDGQITSRQLIVGLLLAIFWNAAHVVFLAVVRMRASLASYSID